MLCINYDKRRAINVIYAILADLIAKIQLFLHISKKNTTFVPDLDKWRKNNT